MAHYAFLDENNIVIEVIKGLDETELIEGLNPETWYGNLKDLKCLRTSYNSKIRGNYAGIGYSYIATRDIFMPPKCHESATLDDIQPIWNCTDLSHKENQLLNLENNTK